MVCVSYMKEKMNKMEEKYYIVRFHSNYGDEFDVESIKAMTEKEIEAAKIESKESLKYYFEEEDVAYIRVSFGTNEALIFYSEKDYWESFDYIECTKEIYDFHKKNFYRGKTGLCFPLPLEY